LIGTFKSDLCYGASGTTKTSQIGRAALWALKKYGKRTRLVSADGGGWEPLDPLVREGIIVPWAIRTREARIEAMDKACQGYWPSDLDNAASPLEPPTVIAYELRCRRCIHEGKPKLIYGPATAQPRGVICPTCKAATVGSGPNDLELKALQYANPRNDLREFALYGIEGLTSFGDTILEHLMGKRASLSQDPSFTWVDGDTGYSGGNMTYYGFAQNRLYEWVMKSHMIPFIEKVIWTALEGKGEEEGTKIPIFGPSIAGKKATGKASQWFGNTLHLESVQETGAADDNKQLKITNKIIMYVRNHADGLTRIPFQAKVRAPFQLAHELPDFVDPDIAKLYDKLEEMKQRVEKQLAVEFSKENTKVATTVTK
jgi:hypothetical protein